VRSYLRRNTDGKNRTRNTANFRRTPKIIMTTSSFWCRLGLHKWAHWIYYKTMRSWDPFAMYQVNEYDTYKRACLKCEIVSFKQILVGSSIIERDM